MKRIAIWTMLTVAFAVTAQAKVKKGPEQTATFVAKHEEDRGTVSHTDQTAMDAAFGGVTTRTHRDIVTWYEIKDADGVAWRLPTGPLNWGAQALDGLNPGDRFVYRRDLSWGTKSCIELPRSDKPGKFVSICGVEKLKASASKIMVVK